MVCHQVQTLISPLIDGELTGRERELLEMHLAECPACRALLAELTSQDRQLREALTARQARTDVIVERACKEFTARGTTRCRVLVVDDESALLTLFERLLERDFEVLTASSVNEAEEILRLGDIHILLTDMRMPGRSGIDLLEWAHKQMPRTVRLMMTADEDVDDTVDAINRGRVYSFIRKPFRTDDLLLVMRNAAEKFQLERKQDRYLEELRQLTMELEKRVADRTKELEEANQLLQQRARELERLALTDPLTGLFNRRAMDELARFELKRHARYPSPLSIGYIDVDHFKHINTQYLLTGGDETLKGLARILTSAIRGVDSIGRFGGEEFMVLARETGAEGASALAERLRATVAATPIQYNGQDIRITVSVGFAVAGVGIRADYAQICEQAAAALDHAKRSGRNRCEVRSIATAQAG